ncbi:hypothetical protein Poly30_52980 [Planctomycetes bacterium Poly30]|uniref:Uncharacterized protein n=1 Tax=Saltatorellus ferox TaxID=2528018 RepID=A0A518F090_9BACT|nr:hypothetical protein Poly30_52980 [Planctomycetes bacterium Poly30]
MTPFSRKPPLPEHLPVRIAEAARAADVDAALVQMGELFQRLPELPAVQNAFGGARPPIPAAVLTALVAGAMNRKGQADKVEPLVRAVSEVYTPLRPRDALDRAVSGIAFVYPFLLVPLVESALATGDAERALELLGDVQGPGWATRASWFDEDPFLAEVLGHEAIATRLNRLPGDDWILDRKLDVRAARTMDFRVERDVDFDTELLRAALIVRDLERALPVVEEHLAERDRILRLNGFHLGFHSMLVLAGVGRNAEAMELAREIVRHGYGLSWRFRLESALEMPWTQAVHQNEYLAVLAATPEYQAWIDAEVRHIPPSKDDPVVLCHVEEGTWGGKKRRKCAWTREWIEPGEAVVRIRRLFDPASSNDVEIVAPSAMASGPLAEARAQFERYRIPIDRLFPDPRRVRSHWGHSGIAALAHDLAFDPASLDLDRAVRLMAGADPPAPRFLWTDPAARQGWREPFPPFAGDDGYGDPVTLFWRLWRAGYGAEIVERVTALPAAMADKLMAMIGTVNDADLRSATALHFGLEELPAMMDLAFTARLSLKHHRTLADFGRDHPRYRSALVATMRSYGLHLYNTGGPTANWYLDGLNHYAYAHGSQLLYFLIHTPEDDSILAQMIEKELLPRDTGRGGYSYYDDTKSMYYRAACLHLAWHAPDRMAVWTSGWIAETMTRSYDRATKRLIPSAIR